MTWNTQAGTLKILQRRIDKIKTTISEIQQSNILKIRKVHSFVGQIISLSPVYGNVPRLMTRHCQVLISQAADEDNFTRLDEHCIAEIKFWKENTVILNARNIFSERKINKIACCDASSTDAGSIICNDVHITHKLWTESEAKRSSTWRELNTIDFAISSFLPIISHSYLKVFTDSQTAARIVEVGSMKKRTTRSGY